MSGWSRYRSPPIKWPGPRHRWGRARRRRPHRQRACSPQFGREWSVGSLAWPRVGRLSHWFPHGPDSRGLDPSRQPPPSGASRPPNPANDTMRAPVDWLLQLAATSTAVWIVAVLTPGPQCTRESNRGAGHTLPWSSQDLASRLQGMPAPSLGA